MSQHRVLSLTLHRHLTTFFSFSFFHFSPSPIETTTIVPPLLIALRNHRPSYTTITTLTIVNSNKQNNNDEKEPPNITITSLERKKKLTLTLNLILQFNVFPLNPRKKITEIMKLVVVARVHRA
ncbi:hypothetical protein AAZX31_06G016300 [Glycine max]